ncbi:argininosuccinate lyase [Roseovarius spongiae]|uniref:Argininosuccinate lyase n=1 Tax=Roseovarius spongiae TaxID=2320272 RepID=A0A3A8AY33_9RHOB|nr:argininosuccinate lyase [Roseovarius spongiae]RKF16279.1 argininosuccinate lyase [Roseovarius spongiae]
MRMTAAIALFAALAACGVDGPPVRPSVNTTVGVGSNGTNATVGTDWISGRVSTHVGVGF